MGSNSQLFLDDCATVTLRNMIIETIHSYPGQPALALSSGMSKLALDNVKLSLGDDWYVNRGQLFFHNDVVVTGTSALVYRSTMPSYIASHGCLMFDNATTFSYAPATDNKDLFVLSDESSRLAFNGSSLCATHTGLRLSKGRLYLDDKIILDGTRNNVINETTPMGASQSIATVDTKPTVAIFSLDGKYVAVLSTDTTKTIDLFGCNNGILTFITSYSLAGLTPTSMAWSPDGKYIAVVSASSPGSLRIISFSGSSLSLVGSAVSTGNKTYSVTWSPDGRYLVVYNLTTVTSTMQLFAFSGSTPVKIGDDITVGANTATGTFWQVVAWSSDGKYVAVVNKDSSELLVFAFANGSLIQLGSAISTGMSPVAVSWSPDNKYVAVAAYGEETFAVYSFSALSPTPFALIGSRIHVNRACDVTWSPDGRYIAVADYTRGYVHMFKFSSNYSATEIGNKCLSAYIGSVDWCKDGQYILASRIDITSPGSVYVMPVNYLNDNSSITSQIIFGNSTFGSSYDLDVHVLAGARVEVNGNVFHDPA